MPAGGSDALCNVIDQHNSTFSDIAFPLSIGFNAGLSVVAKVVGFCSRVLIRIAIVRDGSRSVNRKRGSESGCRSIASGGIVKGM